MPAAQGAVMGNGSMDRTDMERIAVKNRASELLRKNLMPCLSAVVNRGGKAGRNCSRTEHGDVAGAGPNLTIALPVQTER